MTGAISASRLVLPRQWTSAKIRVGPGGKVQVGFAAKEAARIARAGNPGRGFPGYPSFGTGALPRSWAANPKRHNPPLLHVHGRGWIQESYDTGSPELRRRAKSLRAAGYSVNSFSLGSQVTQWGRAKLTMLDIRPGSSGDPYLENVGRQDNPAARGNPLDETRVFIGPKRKDGKYSARFVYEGTGRKIDKLLDDEKLAKLRSDPRYAVCASGRSNPANPKCRTCGGTKRVPCPACARTGYVSRACIHCGGQGGADCPDCLKRKPKTGRNPGKPTLAQWLRQPGADAHEAIRNVPGLVGIHDVRAIEPIRWELWNLADYRVESARAGVIWLVRRREANRRSRGRNPHAAGRWGSGASPEPITEQHLWQPGSGMMRPASNDIGRANGNARANREMGLKNLGALQRQAAENLRAKGGTPEEIASLNRAFTIAGEHLAGKPLIEWHSVKGSVLPVKTDGHALFVQAMKERPEIKTYMDAATSRIKGGAA